jgi:hypothetical protein
MFREILTVLNDLVLKGCGCEDIRTDTPVISFPEIPFVTEARVAETVGRRGQVVLSPRERDSSTSTTSAALIGPSAYSERWLKCLKEGGQRDPEHRPDWMQHPIMRQAMGILSRFSEKERDDHRDQSRQEALRVQRTIQRRLDEAIAEAETERQAKEAAREAEQTAREREQAALAEIARLKALLNQSGNS